MQKSEKRFCVYVAITDCLPAFVNQNLRPIKIGKARCLRERFETINTGHKMEETKPSKKSLPLAGCTKWRMIAATQYVFSEQKATDLEDTARKALQEWKLFGKIAPKVIKTAKKQKRKTSINGLSEIVVVDMKTSDDDFIVAAEKYSAEFSLTEEDLSVLKKLIGNAMSTLNDKQPTSLEITCAAPSCSIASVEIKNTMVCEGFLKKCRNPISFRNIKDSSQRPLNVLPQCTA